MQLGALWFWLVFVFVLLVPAFLLLWGRRLQEESHTASHFEDALQPGRFLAWCSALAPLLLTALHTLPFGNTNTATYLNASFPVTGIICGLLSIVLMLLAARGPERLTGIAAVLLSMLLSLFLFFGGMATV